MTPADNSWHTWRTPWGEERWQYRNGAWAASDGDMIVVPPDFMGRCDYLGEDVDITPLLPLLNKRRGLA